MRDKLSDKTQSETRNSINYSYINGITDAVIKALTTGPLLTTYAVGIGLSNLSIGFLQSILPFSNLIHLYVAKLLEKGASPHKIAWISSLLARPFLLVIAASIFFKGSQQAILLFVIPYILAHICASFTSGAFWPWCKEFVPNRLMTSYFAYRTQFIGAAKMITFIIATGIIYIFHTQKPDVELYCYSIFYIIAFIAGLLCTYALYKIKDVKLKPLTEIPFIQKIKIAFKNKTFVLLFTGIGLANFVLAFFTSFNIVFLLKSIKLTAFIVMCFSLFANIIEIAFAHIWRRFAIRKNTTTLISTSSIVFTASIINFIVLTFIQIQNPIQLTLFLSCTAMLLGIGSSGFLIGINAICVGYVPDKMSSIYLSLLNIGRFGSTGLGSFCGGILLQIISKNEFQWTIFFVICLFLYLLTSVITAKIQPVTHIS